MAFKIRTKLIIAFFSIIFSFIIIGGILVLYSANAFHKSVHKVQSIAEERAVITKLILAMEEALMPGNDYIITGDKKYIDDFYKVSDKVEKRMKEAKEILHDPVEEGKILDDTNTAWRGIKEMSLKIFAISNPAGNRDAAMLMEEMDYKWAYPAIKRLEDLREIHIEEFQKAVKTADKVWMHSWIIVIVGTFVLIGVSTFFTLFYSRIFVLPIKQVHNGADAIAKGDFKVRLDIKTGDEIEQLSKAMNEMAKQLDTLYLSMGEKIEEGIKKFAAISESANDAIIVLSSPDVIHFWNKKAEEIFGYKIDEVVGKSVHDLVVPQKFREKAKGGLDNFFKTGKGPVVGKVVEVFGMRKDGREFPIELSVSAVRIGEEWQAIGIIRDITERKRAEEAIKESEERFRRLVEYSPHGIAVHSEGKLLYINPIGASLLGASDTKELIGRSVMDFLHPDYKEIVIERIRKILEEGKESPSSEEKFIRLDGSILDAEVSAVSVIYSGKQAVLVHFSDITERKEAEKALKQRLDELEQFRKVTIQRELRMEELKRKNKELEEELKILRGMR